MSMVFPVTGLRKSDRLAIQVLERNFSGTDFIDRFKATLDGPPPFSIVGQSGIADLKCREFDEATRDKLLAPREEDARRLFAELTRWRPDPSAQDFAWPREQDEKAEEGLHAIAALLGWDHPRVKPWVAGLVSARAARTAAFAGIFAAERAASSEAKLSNGLVIRGRRVANDIELEAQNRGTEAVNIEDLAYLYVFDAGGARDEYSTEVDLESPLEPGAAATLRYRWRQTQTSRPKGDGASVRPPFLVRGKLYTIGGSTASSPWSLAID